MKIPFVGPSYQAGLPSADAQRSYNCFLELDKSSQRAPVALVGRPGLVTPSTFSPGPIRGTLAFENTIFIVSGNTVWSAHWSGTAWDAVYNLGTIGSSSGPVGMAWNGTQAIIVDGVGGWLVTLTTFAQITDVSFPNGVTSATDQDGYFIVCGDGSEKFYTNHTAKNGAVWNTLDYASAEGSPDELLCAVSAHREVWLGGRHSFEVWINTGNADFPFERNESAFIEIGTTSKWSVRALDNTIYWLGRDVNGHGIVYRAQGYVPVRVSDHGVEEAMRRYSTLEDAIAYTFQTKGHTFYVLNFPTADATWVFDVSTSQWFEWGWRDPATGTAHRWRPAFHSFIAATHFVGDWENGRVYRLSLDALDDNGDAIQRLRVTQAQDNADGYGISYQQIRIDMEVGTGSGDVKLRYSDDGGRTWSGYKTKTLTAGNYKQRVKFGPCGQGRNRLWELSTIDPIKWAIYGAYVNEDEGTS